MRTTLQSLVVGTLILFAGVTMAADPGPFVGTWNMNTAKSTFTGRAGPQSATRVYTPAGDAVHMAVTGIGSDGKPFSQTSTFKIDGGDAPFSGNPNWDTMAVKRLDATCYEAILKKAGKVIGIVVMRFSDDGKTVTQVLNSINADGTISSSPGVFERQ